jgi:uncharacterized protein YlaI
MKYKCKFPGCTYKTESRTQIHKHHIISKELGGSDNEGNRIFLCPNCHNRIFIPEAESGIHSFEHDNSIIINNKLDSTSGIVLEYIDHGETKYWFYS